jgi:hypothetical protein
MKCMRKEVVVAQFEHLSPENEKNHERNDRGQLVSMFGFERAGLKITDTRANCSACCSLTCNSMQPLV